MCTTILVGKKASYDGSTLIARTEDSQNGVFTPKAFQMVLPKDQPYRYQSVLSRFAMTLPDNPLAYSSVPDALGEDGIWGQAGINEANVAMSATETITTNPRVLGADPLVETGIGEEDILTLVLPYIRTAREGVERLGQLLEAYGTYESNGIAFSDVDEIWWMETVGGHHWIARRVPDDAYVVVANQLGIDHFEFHNSDDYMCSSDLKEFIEQNHLELNESNEHFNPRYAFGSQRDKDKHYNTPRTWFIQKYLNPRQEQDPKSFFIPWQQKPYRKITIEDIKYVLSGYYQDTDFDPYSSSVKGRDFRPIGINRTSHMAILQLRPDRTKETTGIQWLSFGSMPFNTSVPFFTQVSQTPQYMSNTTAKVSTDNFYWTNRLIAGLCDPHFHHHQDVIEAYVQETMALGQAMIYQVDKRVSQGEVPDLELENQALSDKIEEKTNQLLARVLTDASNLMTNRYGASD